VEKRNGRRISPRAQAIFGIALMFLLGFEAKAEGHGRRRPFNHGTVVPIFTGMGDPLPGVANNRGDLTIFSNGQLNFKEIDTLNSADASSGPNGQLGPLFNNVSCAACHDHPASGGGGLFIREIRVRNRGDGAPPVQIFAVDNMLHVGPQTQGAQAIFPFGDDAPILGGQISSLNNNPSLCQQQLMTASTYNPSLPVCDTSSASFAGGANCIGERSSLQLMGDGLVEATDDSTFEQIAASQPANVRGTVRMVTELNQLGTPAAEVSPATLAALGTPHVGRFGWKAQHATLLGFAGDAYLNEIGITNDLNSVPNSTCALNVVQFGVTLQSDDDPEDSVDSTGRADIDRFSDFIRALQPPPEIKPNSSASQGAKLFVQAGCEFCHLPSITTSSNPAAFLPPSINGTPITASLNRTLAKVTYHPFSDFLLHDMGSLGDGIKDGVASPTMIRTAPLWGIRAREVFLHDGRATDLPTAISLHDGQGKAAAAAFSAFTPQQQQNLIDFLNTL
jgi:CxxC motif-containing protein (DUF1111 family)